MSLARATVRLSATSSARERTQGVAVQVEQSVGEHELLAQGGELVLGVASHALVAGHGCLLVRSDSRTAPTLGSREGLVAQAVGLVRLGAESLVTLGLVVREVPFKPAHHRVALEGEHVGGDAVEEP